MLTNAYLLANIGADTAENERNFAKHWPMGPGRLGHRIGPLSSPAKHWPMGPPPGAPTICGSSLSLH